MVAAAVRYCWSLVFTCMDKQGLQGSSDESVKAKTAKSSVSHASKDSQIPVVNDLLLQLASKFETDEQRTAAAAERLDSPQAEGLAEENGKQTVAGIKGTGLSTSSFGLDNVQRLHASSLGEDEPRSSSSTSPRRTSKRESALQNNAMHYAEGAPAANGNGAQETRSEMGGSATHSPSEQMDASDASGDSLSQQHGQHRHSDHKRSWQKQLSASPSHSQCNKPVAADDEEQQLLEAAAALTAAAHEYSGSPHGSRDNTKGMLDTVDHQHAHDGRGLDLGHSMQHESEGKVRSNSRGERSVSHTPKRSDSRSHRQQDVRPTHDKRRPALSNLDEVAGMQSSSGFDRVRGSASGAMPSERPSATATANGPDRLTVKPETDSAAALAQLMPSSRPAEPQAPVPVICNKLKGLYHPDTVSVQIEGMSTATTPQSQPIALVWQDQHALVPPAFIFLVDLGSKV